MNASEIAALADRLGMSEGKFRAVYTRRIGDSDVSLKEKSNHECIFYKEDKGCTIYQHRPRQCRTWPFWQSVVATPATWAQEALECPGMNHGPTHLSEHVYELSQHDGTFGNPPADE